MTQTSNGEHSVVMKTITTDMPRGKGKKQIKIKGKVGKRMKLNERIFLHSLSQNVTN